MLRGLESIIYTLKKYIRLYTECVLQKGIILLFWLEESISQSQYI